MYEESQIKKIGKSKPEVEVEKAAPFVWSSLPVSTLIRYRDEITRHLPPTQLSKMNLEEELLMQFHTVRALQNDVMEDTEIPVNQRAQVANSVAASLNKLAEMQIDLYSAERFKNVENLLIRTLSQLPEDLASEFLTEYEKMLGSHE
jgi:uncharacterized protein (UPF0147 family)